MTELVRFHRFRRRYLALTIGLMMLPTAHAMQELSDHSLSDTTGEGVALVLDNFKMVMQAPNDISSASSYNKYMRPIIPGADASPERMAQYNQDYLNYYNKASQYDTGFIRIIPTGENYQQLSDQAFSKVYQPTYNAQYQTSYNTLKNEEYDRVYKIQFSDEYQRLRNIKYEEFRTAEFANTSGKLYKERYDYWVDFHSGWAWETNYLPIWERTEVAKTKANNDLNNVQEWKDELHNKVEGKLNEPTEVDQLTNQARPTAETNSNNLATQYAQNNAQQHTNQQIRGDINSATDMSNRKTKADVFIYGLALSKSDGSLSTRFSNQGFNWGSADNPWLFRAGSQIVKQFTDEAKEIGYLALEAPLATVVGSEADNNIKLGFWTDIFARGFNSSNEVDPITGGPKEGLDANERLRLQFVANGLSLNGSHVKLFQTLNSSELNYSKTLGIAGIVRLNTDDNSANAKFVDNNLVSRLNKYNATQTNLITQLRSWRDVQPPVLPNDPTEQQQQTYNTQLAAYNTTKQNLKTSLENNGLDLDLISEDTQALANIYKNNPSEITQWNADRNKKGIRLSTATLDDVDSESPTPAMKRGGEAPIFNDVEGMYIYSPNINLVLGNIHQPFIVGSEGNNIILEVTRIPDNKNIYDEIYQDYNADMTNPELNKICSVYSCGATLKANNTDLAAKYQGNTATHSSISIGSVERVNGMLKAKTTPDATGIVFKDASGNSKNFGSAVIDGVLIQHLKIKTTGL